MKFQLLAAHVNLGASRDDVVYRGEDNPVTLPEVLVLRAIHGGEEHVHSLVSLGTVERDPRTELDRLTSIYGEIALKVFPTIGGQPSLPGVDEAIPDKDEVDAASAAAEAAMEAARAKKGRAKKADAAPLPPLDELSN